MPVILTNKIFTDLFGGSSTYYKVNAGDLCTIKLEFDTNIRVSTLDTPIYLDPTTNSLTAAAFNFLNEGFRDGDVVRFTRYSSGGSVLSQWTTGIQSITATIMNVGTILGWNTTNGEFMVIEVTTRNRDDLDVFFNQVLNSTAGGTFSLIDGEPTRINFPGLDSIAVSGSVNGIAIPNRSGSFNDSAIITRLANPSTYTKRYELELNVYQGGIYDSTWFDSGDCLKNLIRLSWASVNNEPYNRYEYTFSDNADTGYFEEGYNSEISDVTMTNGFSSLDYGAVNNFTAIVTASAGYEGMGAAYIPIDSTYYKNRTFTQQELTMLLNTQAVTTSPSVSFANPDGADYTLELNTPVTNVGYIYSINAKFTPSAAFTTFMDGRETGDRRMIVWAKFGNTNTILFDGQSETAGAGDQVLNLEQNIFLDHSVNEVTSTETELGYEADTEDDLAFTGVMLFDKNSEKYNGLTASIVAYNTTTLEEFTLTSAFWDIASIPFVGGQYVINQTIPVQSQLPTTSEKRNALLYLDPSYDTVTEYGVRVYFPFLLRWEYWLSQANANNDFYPNEQTKNWFPYGNTGDWTIQLKLRLTTDDLNYIFRDTITDKIYNDNLGAIVQDIQLEIVSTGQMAGVIAIGEMMKVIATHTLVDGGQWDYPNVWGMITCEPFEASQRYISSTVIDYDFDSNNPLTPLAGETKCKMTWTAPNVVTLECLFNPNLINLDNGVSFTTKIKGCSSDEPIDIYKMMTDGQFKIMTDGQFKKLS